MTKDILLTVDYHDAHCMIRRKNLATGQETIRKVTADRDAKPQRGRAVWVQESTTGWARMAQLAAECRVEFVLANVLQMPLPPQGKRRKTDTIDTARLQREYLNGQLPRAHQPTSEWRQLRRVVALRVNLVRRRTAVSNWINRYLAHETWLDPRCRGVRSQRGRARVRTLPVPATDRRVLDWKLEELQQIERRLVEVDALLLEHYRQSLDAQRLDAIRGLGPIGAIAIVARIGPVARFETADQLIAFAGLSPGVRQSDATCRGGKIGGGAT
jgi:transposase